MRRRIRLQTRLILWVTALLISVVGMMSFLFYGILVDAVEEQIGKRALSLSENRGRGSRAEGGLLVRSLGRPFSPSLNGRASIPGRSSSWWGTSTGCGTRPESRN